GVKVVAPPNPGEMEGSCALPEAQRDRFMAKVSMGYPVAEAELAMLRHHTSANPLDLLDPVTDVSEVRALIAVVNRVHVAETVQRYAVALTTATRTTPELRL